MKFIDENMTGKMSPKRRQLPVSECVCDVCSLAEQPQALGKTTDAINLTIIRMEILHANGVPCIRPKLPLRSTLKAEEDVL